MPSFCYTDKKGGTTIERVFSMGKAPRTVRVDGVVYLRDIAKEWSGRKNTESGNWPMWSDAAGCDPSQIGEAQSVLRRAGLSADYNSEGQVKFTSALHRKKCLKALGYYDRNGT